MVFPNTKYSTHDKKISLSNNAKFWEIFSSKILRDSLDRVFDVSLGENIIYLEKDSWLDLVKDWYDKILEKTDDWKVILYLTEWISQIELIQVIKAIAVNDYGINKIKNLSENLKNAWIYIAKNISLLESDSTKEIVKNYATEFFNLWQEFEKQLNLESNIPKELIKSDELQNEELSLSEEEIEKWLIWEDVYENRKNRFKNNKWKIKQKRFKNSKINLFKRYFKALEKEWYEEYIEKDKEHRRWPIMNLQYNTKDNLDSIVRTPEYTFVDTLMSIGKELLVNELWFEVLKDLYEDLTSYFVLKNKVPRSSKEKELYEEYKEIYDKSYEYFKNLIPIIEKWEKEWYKTFWEAMQIPELKKEYKEKKENLTPEELEKEEIRIVKEINSIVPLLPYWDYWFNPSFIKNTGRPCCQGYSFISTIMLREIWLDYFSSDFPCHSPNTLKTSNNNLFVVDYYNNEFVKIRDQDLIDWDVNDVVKKLWSDMKNVMELNLKDEWYNKRLPKLWYKWFNKSENRFFHIYPPWSILNDESLFSYTTYETSYNKQYYNKDMYYTVKLPVENQSGFFNFLNAIGDYYYTNKDYHRAIKYYEKLANTQKNSYIDYNFRLADLYYKVWNYWGALKYYKIYVKSRKYLSMDEYYRLWNLYYLVWDKQNAKKYYDMMGVKMV